jgi:hypothetical protein
MPVARHRIRDVAGRNWKLSGAAASSREKAGYASLTRPTSPLRFARKQNLETPVRQNNPTGKSLKTLSSPSDKNIPLNPSGKSSL